LFEERAFMDTTMMITTGASYGGRISAKFESQNGSMKESSVQGDFWA
jgi:hypothetical protein